MKSLISVPEFVDYLKMNDMLIVSRLDYEVAIDREVMILQKLQERLLHKDSLTVKEIILAKLLPIHTRQSISNWIDSGIIKEGEVWTTKQGQLRIITQAIIRLRKLNNYTI